MVVLRPLGIDEQGITQFQNIVPEINTPPGISTGVERSQRQHQQIEGYREETGRAIHEQAKAL